MTTTAIEIGAAQKKDLIKAILLDEQITQECFVPIFMQYADVKSMQSPMDFINDATADEIEMFQQAIRQENNQCLFLAYDEAKVVGLIAFEKILAHATIHLLIIDQRYRKQNIGRLLLAQVLTDDIQSCDLLCLEQNMAGRCFYEACNFQLKPIPIPLRQHDPYTNFWDKSVYYTWQRPEA